MSYRALDEQAQKTAIQLTNLGVHDNVPVPILLERSVAALVALFAVLKAGGAFVPLDPAWPADRIQRILGDLEADRPLVAVITSSALSESLDIAANKLLLVDAPVSVSVSVSASYERRIAEGLAEQLAYIIYTSGSTGTPKGVMVSHANLFNSTRARARFYPDEPGTFLLLSPLAADSAMVGVFWTLCCGGTLLLARHRGEQDPMELCRFASTHAATHMLCLPSLHSALLEFGSAERLASLKAVIVAGEACTRDLVERHHQQLPDTALFNEYGPSEATIWATATRLDASEHSPLVSIGRPIANTVVYILDDALRPVPVGVAGELFIGGDNLARGYHGSPDLTAERFVMVAIDGQPAMRMYRTGDLARWREAGDIEFLGRVDLQVKIRGNRVELEEVEAVLNTHPAVSESAVYLLGTDSAGLPGVVHETLFAALFAMPQEQAEIVLCELERMPDALLYVELQRHTHDAGEAR